MSVWTSLSDFFSAHFLAPESFALLGLIPVVILLYLLKLRRTEIIIGSTILWKKSLADLTANAPFQRLRKNLLLFLQVLILLLIVTALARPFVQHEGYGGTNVCLLIDRSGSMNVRERDRSRLEIAKNTALDVVNDMQGPDKAMVVTFGERADVQCDLTDDRVRLRQAISAIRPSDTRSNIKEAMLLVRSLHSDNPKVVSVLPNLRVLMLSDGKLSDIEELAASAMKLHYVKIGDTAANAGIVAFSVRGPEQGQGERQAFAVVHNESTQPLSTTLTLYIDERSVASAEINVAAGADQEVVFPLPELGQAILRAELDHRDALDVDNRAWLTLRPPARIKVLLVAKDDSAGAYYLKHALALEPRAELVTTTPGDYTNTGGYDLTIFDSWVPKELPSGCLLFVNAVPHLAGVQAEGKIDNPPVLAVDHEHGLTRFLNPGAVRIGEALRLKLPDGSRTLVSTTGGPLIADVSRGNRRIAVVAFDLAHSSWPLHLSFPLFIQNLVTWVPNASPQRDSFFRTGDPLSIMPVPDADHATVTLPDGTTQRLEMAPLRPTFFGGTERAGIYRVSVGERTIAYAVNLLDRNETSITPSSSLRIGRGEIRGHVGKIKQNREYWQWMLLLALGGLVAEWWIFSRRALM